MTACVAALIGLALVVDAQAATRSPYVPAAEAQRIVAYFGKTYLPGWLPRGYIYARWEPMQGSADAFGEYLELAFGDRGARLQWTVDDPADTQEYSHGDCSKHPFGHPVTVNGTRIVYNGGAVGQTATLCISKYRAVTVWNGYSVSAATLERIAASAIPVG